MLSKTEILAILNDWNYWNRDFDPSIERPLYDDKIRNFMKHDEIVVIKGVRRCGKSTLMLNQMKRLHQNGIDKRAMLFINLEDPRFINHLNLELLEHIKEVYLEYVTPSIKPYVFLDEVQNIPNWEKWVNKEQALKTSHISVTGSNSSLLSSEIGTALSGRYISVDVYPLSFNEYLLFKGMTITSTLEWIDSRIAINREFNLFIKEGGFPKLLSYPQSEKKELLASYKDSILLKDIVARFALKNYSKLEEIAAFLMANSGTLQSVTKLKNNFGISHDMASDYVEYLEKAYMIFELRKFDYSLKKQIANLKKYYTIDLGLSNILRVAGLQTLGADMESIVFLELKRRGFVPYYYKTANDLEIDFVVTKEGKIVELIQVANTVSDEKTLKRELAPFSKTMDELGLSDVICTLLCDESTEEIVSNGLKIGKTNIKEWLIHLR
ncbi:MAG: ATP-binding protein [Sulfuricurvum sp.]|nr:ATP-binding protein [Sulfuricurvum sp.]